MLTVIGAIGDRERIANLDLAGTDGVDRVVPISKPYKLASSQFKHGEEPSSRSTAARSGAATSR